MIEIGSNVSVTGDDTSVDIRGRHSDVMPHVTMSANGFKRWYIPTTAGAQSVVLSQYSDESSGVIAGEIFNDDFPIPPEANNHTEVILYQNGGKILIDTEAGTVSFSGFDIIVNGNLKVNGTITDSVGLLTDHEHTGVMSGGSNTGGRP